MKKTIEVNGIKYILHQKIKTTKVLYLLKNALEGKEKSLRFWMKMLSHSESGEFMTVQVRSTEFPQFQKYPVITAILNNTFYSVEHGGKYLGDDKKMYMNIYIRLMDEREVNQLIPEIRYSSRTKDGNAEIILKDFEEGE